MRLRGYYRIRKGEGYIEVAKKFGLMPDVLASFNNGIRLHTGQYIKIPYPMQDRKPTLEELTKIHEKLLRSKK